MTPGKLDLIIRRGVAWEGARLECTDGNGDPSDFTGCTAHAQARRQPGKELAFDVPATVSTEEAGVITLDAMTTAETAALPVGRYRWDLVTEEGGERTGPWLAGDITVEDIITQPAA